jgi:hypothetical protein
MPHRNEWHTNGIFILQLRVTLWKRALPEKLIVALQLINFPLLMENKESFRVYKVMSVILSSTKNTAFPSSTEPITKSISKMCPQTCRRIKKELQALPHGTPPAIHHQAL